MSDGKCTGETGTDGRGWNQLLGLWPGLAMVRLEEQCEPSRWKEPCTRGRACLRENGLTGREDCLGTEPGLAIGPDGSAGVGLGLLGRNWAAMQACLGGP